MIDSPRERDPVEVLADEFASRCRNGESPSIAEYTAKFPEYAREIEELFPAVAMMERLRVDERSRLSTGSGGAGSGSVPDHLGDFDILREIGRGGMGIVYEAEQRSLGRRVALKVLPKHALLLDKHLKRFRREAQTAAKLQHTNIVPVFGVGDQDDLHYYVMPLVRGVGLDEVIRRMRAAGSPRPSGAAARGAEPSAARELGRIVQPLAARKFGAADAAAPSPEDRREGAVRQVDVSADTSASPRSSTRPFRRPNGAQTTDGKRKERRSRAQSALPGTPPGHWRIVAHVGIQAADALDYAHRRGTLHRDVKPGNLLVDGDGVVSVADFGLARAVDQTDASRSGEVVGTLRYMAPEQLRGSADARSDVYALGVTLYELLTLRPAFADADRPHGAHRRRAGCEPPRPRKIDPSVPPDLETIVLKCLAPEPSKRYPTAAALAADLRRFLEDRPIRARRASRIERAWRWCRRNPALAAVSALAALLVVAVAATGATGYVQTQRAYRETTDALGRAEATSRLSLEVLEGIYLQLSPDRVWISSDSNPGGEACACIGLRSGASSTAAGGWMAVQVQASRETAALLENLLVFYDRLAEQVSNDSQVMLQSAIASRRVGNIRQRLGQIDQAEREYLRGVEKLTALVSDSAPDPTIRTELARAHNEIGNVRSARFDMDGAHEAHRQALSVLQPFAQADDSPEDFRFELARTLYFLSSQRPSVPEAANRREPADALARWPGRSAANDHRKAAIGILERLARENPDAPDYRFLLALCYRPPAFLPTTGWQSESASDRRRAIRILEQLKSEYPGVADYRYELTATYAWVPVGLFPWQGRSPVPPAVERNLLKALDESEWLVEHNPTIPHYACCRALILAKLGMACWNGGRPAEAKAYFQKAFDVQRGAVARSPDLPAHNRVVMEFMRLRLGQIGRERAAAAEDLDALADAGRLLQTSTENLAELTAGPEAVDDRLAATSLQVGYAALGRVLEELGESEEARQAAKRGAALRRQSAEQGQAW